MSSNRSIALAMRMRAVANGFVNAGVSEDVDSAKICLLCSAICGSKL